MKEDPKELAKKLAKSAGRHKALSLLIAEGISPSTADKLVRGKYPSEVKELMGAAILRAVERKEAS